MEVFKTQYSNLGVNIGCLKKRYLYTTILSFYLQWKGTWSVIKWFSSFENKERVSLMVFDIECFYSSISENLFIKAIQFAKLITKITDEGINLIIQSRKTLLFN